MQMLGLPLLYSLVGFCFTSCLAQCLFSTSVVLHCPTGVSSDDSGNLAMTMSDVHIDV
jgi:hypothetical protein